MHLNCRGVTAQVMTSPSDPAVEADPAPAQPEAEDSSGISVAAALLQNLVFLNWVQFPPLPRVPDLSDPSKYLGQVALKLVVTEWSVRKFRLVGVETLVYHQSRLWE